jgi:hypothetical protein
MEGRAGCISYLIFMGNGETEENMIGINPPFGDIKWFKRRPSGADKMEYDGWIFLSENRRWDPYEVEQVCDLIDPFYNFYPDAKFYAPESWIRKQTRQYLQLGFITLDMSEENVMKVYDQGRTELVSSGQKTKPQSKKYEHYLYFMATLGEVKDTKVISKGTELKISYDLWDKNSRLLEPTIEDWIKFWKTMESLDVWGWKDRMGGANVFNTRHGFMRVSEHAEKSQSWSLHLKLGDKKFNTIGTNVFPDEISKNYGKTFRDFLEAINSLVGEELFLINTPSP